MLLLERIIFEYLSMVFFVIYHKNWVFVRVTQRWSPNVGCLWCSRKSLTPPQFRSCNIFGCWCQEELDKFRSKKVWKRRFVKGKNRPPQQNLILLDEKLSWSVLTSFLEVYSNEMVFFQSPQKGSVEVKKRLNAEKIHEKILRNRFRFCKKLKKVLWRRFFPCIHGRNTSRFLKTFLWFLSGFQLIWKLFNGIELPCISHRYQGICKIR